MEAAAARRGRRLLDDALGRVHLWDVEDLVGLEAQPPAGVREAVLDRCLGVFLAARAIHRLQEAVLEVQRLKGFGRRCWLREDQLQLVALGQA